MMHKSILYLLVWCLMFCWLSPGWCNDDLKGKKVLVVNSYHETSDAELEIKEGIEQVLQGATIRYFYMDTKKNPQNGPAKAKEAYEVYKAFQPDAVITADDNAQGLFVVPYLKGKVSTPIVFCGVNDDASPYGYPTDEITGILEKKHYKEGVNFARLISPGIQKIAVLYIENSSNQRNINQIQKERSEYPATIEKIVSVENTMGLTEVLRKLEPRVDGLLVLNLAGIVTENGQKLNSNEAMTFVAENWSKITIGASEREIKAGLLCGVVKMNIEQGKVAAGMVKKIFQGTPPSAIAVTQNRNGQRMINVGTAQKIGLTLKPIVLLGTRLVQ